MAYYIDETKKTAVKYEGKSAFAWNVETRRFDLPTTDVSPKSRMTRCSDFEARRYLFEYHPKGYAERLNKLAEAVAIEREPVDPSEMTAEIAEAHLKEAKELVRRWSAEIEELRQAVSNYGMELSDGGKILKNCTELLKINLKLAETEAESVKLLQEIAKCESGQCEGCEWFKSCEKRKRESTNA